MRIAQDINRTNGGQEMALNSTEAAFYRDQANRARRLASKVLNSNPAVASELEAIASQLEEKVTRESPDSEPVEAINSGTNDR